MLHTISQTAAGAELERESLEPVERRYRRAVARKKSNVVTSRSPYGDDLSYEALLNCSGVERLLICVHDFAVMTILDGCMHACVCVYVCVCLISRTRPGPVGRLSYHEKHSIANTQT